MSLLVRAPTTMITLFLPLRSPLRPPRLTPLWMVLRLGTIDAHTLPPPIFRAANGLISLIVPAVYLYWWLLVDGVLLVRCVAAIPVSPTTVSAIDAPRT